MKRIRIFCAFLCALFVLSSVSFGVSAEKAEIAPVGDEAVCYIETYEQLKNLAYTASSEYRYVLNDFIFMDDNQNDREIVIPAGAHFYLDLNGYPIERVTKGNDCALFRIKSGATMIIDDTSESNTGSCVFSEGYSSYYKAVFINDGGELIIKDGYYEILSPYEQGDCSVIRTTSGITEIYGGTFDSSSSWGGDTISVGHDAYIYDAPQVIIYDGTFFGKYQSIDISPMNNFLGFGSLFPNVFVMGGNFYICKKGTDKITPGFAYCNNGWGRVMVAEGTVYASCLNSYDQRFLSGASKKLFSENIDGFTGGYYEVTAPPMILPCNEEKLDYYERLALLCSKEVARSYSEEIYLLHKELFDGIRSALDTIYVESDETESPEIKLVNRSADHKYIRWYVCDEASYKGDDTQWTHLSNYNDVSQWRFNERPEDAQSLILRCVLTDSNLNTYEDLIRIEYEALKTGEIIDTVKINDFSAPVVGANPDFDLTPFADEEYYINDVFWADHTNSGSPVTMKETDTFEAGHTYYLEVWLRTNDGYKFRIDDDEYIDISAYIGSEQAEVSSAGTETAAIIYMEFVVPESRVISEVDVINVDTPYAGRTPDYDALCITRGCNVSSVKWYDVTDGSYELMAEDDAFIAGHIYRVNVMVEAEGDYTFLMVDRYNEAWGYINGVKAIAAAADEDTWLQLGLVFLPCEEEPDTEPTEPSTNDEPTTPSEPSTNDEPTKPTDTTKPSEPAVDKGILGDVNGDGKVNIKDATLIQKYAAKLISLTDAEFLRADVNTDSKVNIKDATAIQKYVAKIETGLPIGQPIA